MDPLEEARERVKAEGRPIVRSYGHGEEYAVRFFSPKTGDQYVLCAAESADPSELDERAVARADDYGYDIVLYNAASASFTLYDPAWVREEAHPNTAGGVDLSAHITRNEQPVRPDTTTPTGLEDFG